MLRNSSDPMDQFAPNIGLRIKARRRYRDLVFAVVSQDGSVRIAVTALLRFSKRPTGTK
jgi:hypothetical protein